MIDATVIMPAYNSAQFITEAIESVRNQSLREWELIVVDDGSSDNTVEIIRDHCREDPRVKLIALSSNQGAAVARNCAIENARGRFIAFLDSDDTWHPNKLKRQFPILASKDAVMACSNYYVIRGRERRPMRMVRCPSIVTHADLLRGDPIGCLTAMYDASKVGKVFMPEIRMRQDWGLWLRLLESGGYGVGVPEPLATLRLHAASLSSNKAKAVYYNFRVLRTEGGLDPVRAAIGTATHLFGAFRRRL